MKRFFLMLILLAFACSKDKEVAKDNPLTVVRLIPGTGENGGCVGILAYSGYPEYVCLDWEGGGDFAEEFIIYYSDTEDEDFTEIARTSEKSYQITDLDFGKPHYFYIIPYNSEYGNGPKSEVLETYRSQKHSNTKFFETSEGLISDFDISPTKLYILVSTNTAVVLKIIDLDTGSIISTLTDSIFTGSYKMLVNSNEEIYLLRSDSKIVRFNPVSQQITAELNSGVGIDGFYINRADNSLYVTRSNSTTVEVYNAELEPAFQFSLNPGFQETRIFAVGNDGNIYASFVDGLTEVGGKKHHLEVRTKEGSLLKTYDFSPRSFLDQIGVDNEGNIYTVEIGLESSAFIYKYGLDGNSLVFVGNLGIFNLNDDVFKFDYSDVVFRADLLIRETIYRIVATE